MKTTSFEWYRSPYDTTTLPRALSAQLPKPVFFLESCKCVDQFMKMTLDRTRGRRTDVVAPSITETVYYFPLPTNLAIR